ncbi:MAG: CRISPR-associated helicase/endonuclease Cas3 [Nitrospinales bacterium]
MGSSVRPDLLRYWGKASRDTNNLLYHPLIYHSLDVAAVADCWLKTDISLQRAFAKICKRDEEIIRAWLLFFISLHDFGKFDVRFQLKRRDIALKLNPLFSNADPDEAKQYDHGGYGFKWFLKEYENFGLRNFDINHPWIKAVTEHHGTRLISGPPPSPRASDEVKNHDREARLDWIKVLRKMFLEPAGIKPGDSPPVCPEMLAGFCCVCDWLGSNIEYFDYRKASNNLQLKRYFEERSSDAERALRDGGIFCRPLVSGGFTQLYPDKTPYGVQTLVESLPLNSGLTIIESPTGSGKTEAAVGYASRLLAQGLAGGIIFALPTQATANAMLERLDQIAERLFPDGSNIVLAHGKARYHPLFEKLKKAAPGKTAQGTSEANSQCAAWLGQSRKRLFLGQIGICTIDQVLLSVLPVRHHFVRAFGVQKNILIVDEVHAYDSYMNGLLDQVLDCQKQSGGTAILLSATLPIERREQLLRIWGQNDDQEAGADYPLVSFAGEEKSGYLSPAELPLPRRVEIEVELSPFMGPSDSLLEKACHAAKDGARIAFICNLVAEAQNLARKLLTIAEQSKIISESSIDLFHSRFRFRDRQEIENERLKPFSKGASEKGGKILVATQVIEQSLDLDFDWMITQLCPVDLLFQRLGRLQRHERTRPVGFETPRCVVLLPENDQEYGSHKCIYEDIRALWRTRELLLENDAINFPKAYRGWIEKVYKDDPWPDEPETMRKAHENFLQEQDGKRFCAKQLSVSNASPFEDTDCNASWLTRDGEMSLNVLPIRIINGGHCTLEGIALADVDKYQRAETINLNTIPVPNSWRKYLPPPKDYLYYLEMEQAESDSWQGTVGATSFTYDLLFGLERREQ